jgi:hypothetical protein
MSDNDKDEFVFKAIVTCKNPMEAEIYPATLREGEIPHRTEWKLGGELTILVPEEWETDALDAVAKASQVFFGEALKDQPSGGEVQSQQGNQLEKQEPAAKPSLGAGADEEELYSPHGQPSFFDQDGLPSPDETKVRAVWPAWVLASLPGTGLGHLYAGKFQMWLYLTFLSLLGLLFSEFTDLYFSFVLVLFSWSIDLGFAAYHVKEHNRRAVRAKQRAEQAEKSFLRSLDRSS